jgi:hypothetical protein
MIACVGAAHPVPLTERLYRSLHLGRVGAQATARVAGADVVTLILRRAGHPSAESTRKRKGDRTEVEHQTLRIRYVWELGVEEGNR